MSIILNGSSGLTAPNFSPTESTKIPTITATVASNALTIGMSSIFLDFRSTTLNDGTITTIQAAPVNIVVPSTATLGTISAQTDRLVVIALNNAGTIELAVVNLAGGVNLDETTLISTTALSTGSTANNVIYSTAARSSVSFRVVGFIDITETTAGTWATAPTTIQGAGGQALAAMGSLGYSQTVQNLTASRTLGTTYYNTTGKPIFIWISTVHSSVTGAIVLSINGVAIYETYNSQSTGTFTGTAVGIIPTGCSYSTGGTAGALNHWFELR